MKKDQCKEPVMAFHLNEATGNIRPISAKEAYEKVPLPSGFSLRCMGYATDPITRIRKNCKAELTPYRITVIGEDGNPEYRYYFREFQNHDDGLGEGYYGKNGLHKGHIPDGNCSTLDVRISKEITRTYNYEEGSIASAIALCMIPCEKKEKTNHDDSKKEFLIEPSDSNYKQPVRNVTFGGKMVNSKPLYAIEFWAHAFNTGTCNDVMTPSNYKQFRSGTFDGNGPKVFMAGICMDSSRVRGEITAQHPEFLRERFFVLSDPFFGESIIMILLDRLDPNNPTRSRRKIDAKSVAAFVLEGFFDYVDDSGQKISGFAAEHGPYFAVMCDWHGIELTIDGRMRKAFVGTVYALGAQLEFFKENDLIGARKILRNWEKAR